MNYEGFNADVKEQKKKTQVIYRNIAARSSVVRKQITYTYIYTYIYITYTCVSLGTITPQVIPPVSKNKPSFN